MAEGSTKLPDSFAASLKQCQRCDAPFVLDWQTSLALLITFAGSALATSAGIGGGAAFVPMFHVMLGFGMKLSTALSQAVITGGAAASLLVNAFRCHPRDPTLPLIDFQLVLVFMPVLLLGVNTGVLLNTMFPEWLLTLLLVALILYLVVVSLRKGLALRRVESEAKRVARRLREHAAHWPPPAHKSHPGSFSSQCGPKLPVSTCPKLEALSCPEMGFQSLPAQHSTPASPATRVWLDAQDGTAALDAVPAAGWSGSNSPWIPAAAADDLAQTSLSASESCSEAAEEAAEDATAAAAVTVTVTVLPVSPRPPPARAQQLAAAAAATPAAPSPCCHPAASLQTGQLVVLWALFSGLQLVRARLEPCSPRFWQLCLAQLLTMAAAVALFSWQTMRRQQQQQRRRWQQQGLQGTGAEDAQLVERLLQPKSGEPLGPTGPSQPSFTWSSLLSSQLVTLLAGLAGGLLGIGGGMVMSPLLMELGVEPLVTAATVSLMVLFSSSTAVVQFSVAGRLNGPYACVFSADGLLASLVGVVLVSQLVRRSGNASIVVFILAGVVASGGLAAGTVGAAQAWQDFASGTRTGFSPLCHGPVRPAP